MRTRLLWLAPAGLVFFLPAADTRTDAARIDFQRQIRPILSDNCFACHGPDEKQRMVGLRLDEREGAFAARPGGPAIVAGNPSSSRLYQRISAKDATRMPPPASTKSLNEGQIALIRRWIEQGADWQTHWSFRPPERRPLPEVKDRAWPRNPIDHFVLARLEREGLRPSPEADRITLVRRLSLDLTGLPPAPAEVDAFLADKSANAYEKVVDRLLASPRYGERMALEWLDLARYADTHGYHIDSHRDMWRWRDWVVDAFNGNLPFDRFTIEQLAGDLLPSPRREQLLATGFGRNHMINFEGGAIPEEYLVEYVVDRVETTATIWLGLTMGCGRCHDHKYDPISQKDFYRYFAFFNTIAEKGLDGRTGNAEPVLTLTTPHEKSLVDELERSISAREKEMPESRVAALEGAWEKTRKLPTASGDRLASHYEFDGHLADTSGGYRHASIARGEVTYGEGMTGRSAGLSGETHVRFRDAFPLDRDQPFSLVVWLRWSNNKSMMALASVPEAGGPRGLAIEFDEFEPLPDQKRGSRLVIRLAGSGPEEVIEVRTRALIPQSAWRHIAVIYDGSAKAAGLKIYVDGKAQPVETLRDRLSAPFHSAASLDLGNKSLGNPYKGSIDDLRIYSRLLSEEEIDHLAVHEPVRSLLADAGGRRSREQRERLREYFLTRDAPETERRMFSELNQWKAEKARLEKSIPTAMIMREMSKPRETFLLGRGDYRNQGEKVSPAAPAALPPLEKDAPPNRLGLARWLVSPSNPLTSRVVVNRYWQMYFGTGLVKTVEDFGSQGEPPSHPELLDRLATEFVSSGWDVKAMQRLIVTSAAYRQSSRAAPALVERDPENRLLARGARFRLPAETVRDNALAISGLLNGEMGGPGVYPYQPKGVWEDIAYGDVYSAQRYTPSGGKDLYRRGMYTFWKRTAPPPALATFDAPDREKCVARRARTNTPLQALVLMNDPTYVEAARALAGRMIGAGDPARRIELAYRLAVARKPETREVTLLRELARRQLSTYRADPESARRLLAIGESAYDGRLDAVELAAWTTVASAILSLDETITRQ